MRYKIIKRKDIKDKTLISMLSKEKHHKHKIIKYSDGTIAWLRDENTYILINSIGLSKIMSLFEAMGLDRNSEIVRDLFRKYGYSLDGYWEIFYWVTNNPKAKKYVPPIKEKTKKSKVRIY